MHFNQRHRHVQGFKARFQRINHRACRTVTGVHHQLEGRQIFDVDVLQQVIDIRIAQVNFLIAAALTFIHRREVVSLRQTLHIAQPGITADWTRAFAHQLHAVVIHRIMTGGDFNAAINTQMEGRKIDFFGAGKANIKHIDARIAQAARQRQLQRFAGQTHIAAQHNGFWLQKLAIGAANTPRNIFIQLFA